MAIAQRLVGLGTAPALATNIIGDVSSGLTATGSTQGTALALSSVINEVSTVSASTGVRLMPDMSPGDMIHVHNSGASTLSVYPPTGESIQSGAANAAFSVATNRAALFIKRSNTAWSAVYGA